MNVVVGQDALLMGLVVAVGRNPRADIMLRMRFLKAASGFSSV
jgi:hypothetical protein|tara:strand:+ start:127 stop:255 length:129 start_codon:yes stop_codon:yes gene_type:complete